MSEQSWKMDVDPDLDCVIVSSSLDAEEMLTLDPESTSTTKAELNQTTSSGTSSSQALDSAATREKSLLKNSLALVPFVPLKRITLSYQQTSTEINVSSLTEPKISASTIKSLIPVMSNFKFNVPSSLNSCNETRISSSTSRGEQKEYRSNKPKKSSTKEKQPPTESESADKLKLQKTVSRDKVTKNTQVTVVKAKSEENLKKINGNNQKKRKPGESLNLFEKIVNERDILAKEKAEQEKRLEDQISRVLSIQRRLREKELKLKLREEELILKELNLKERRKDLMGIQKRGEIEMENRNKSFKVRETKLLNREKNVIKKEQTLTENQKQWDKKLKKKNSEIAADEERLRIQRVNFQRLQKEWMTTRKEQNVKKILVN